MEAILDLRNSGYKFNQIADWLALNGVTTTAKIISNHLKKKEKAQEKTNSTSLEKGTKGSAPVVEQKIMPPNSSKTEEKKVAAPVVKEADKGLILDDPDEDFPDPVLTPEQAAMGLTPWHLMTPRQKEIRRKQRDKARDKLFDNRIDPFLMKILERQDKERQEKERQAKDI